MSCGYFGDPSHSCSCGSLAIERYRSRISGPLLDRIDIHLEVPSVAYGDLVGDHSEETSGAIRTAARSMADEAVSQKDVLVKHGLSDTVLENLAQALAEFDYVVEQGTRARRAHVGASADLDLVAHEVVLIVKAMDGLNPYRFARQPELLAAWASVSHVIATPPSIGNIRPAA
jgi:predicted ATPase with chaperone activity